MAALAYAARGWHVFPLLPNLKKPFRATRGYLDATSDEALIRALWSHWPSANIGVATGASGLVVIDEDLYEGADLSSWMLPPTLTALSARGGQHRFFHSTERITSVPQGKLGQGICIKAEGGYVVAAPSRFQGGVYRWLDPHQPVVELPERIAAVIRRGGRPALSPPRHERVVASEDANARWLAWAMAKTGAGQGDAVGLLLAQQLLIEARNGVVVDVEGTLLAYARQATIDTSDPFSTRDVSRWIRSAQDSDIVRRAEPARSQASTPVAKSPKKNHRSFTEAPMPEPTAATPAPMPEHAHRTDMGNAWRFVAQFGEQVRYVGKWGHWMTWDGRCWQHDWNGEAYRRAKETVRSIYHEAADADDDDRRELIKWAMRSESRERLVALLAVAQSESEVAFMPDAFDTHPWLLSVQNGTLDLRTGALGPHDPSHLISRLAPVAYDPSARCPRWLRFLDRIMGGNAQLITFLQRAVGYSLTDSTREQVLFLLHGNGANGKSRFLEAIEGVLGEYSMSTPTSTLMAKRDNNIPNDVARLKGARFVKAIETEEGNALAESLVKQMTGGDMITARFMRGEWFEFKPTFKLWLAANHLPTIRGTDDGIWRRIRYIPFEVQIPDAEKDETLGDKLRAEYPGILAWAVRGCLDWQRDGLGYPDAVRVASEAYRARMDNIGQFLKEMTERHPTTSVAASRLYSAYETWCAENADRAGTQTRFGRYMGEHGYLKSRSNQGVVWTGLRFRSPLDTLSTTSEER